MTNVPPEPPFGFPRTEERAPPRIPASVRAIRVMLWILVGAVALLLVVGMILAQDAYQVGNALAAPIIIGVPALVLALLCTRRSSRVWIGLLVFESLMLLMALGQLRSPRVPTLVALAIHITLLVLATRRSARRYYRGDPAPTPSESPPDPYDTPGVPGAPRPR